MQICCTETQQRCGPHNLHGGGQGGQGWAFPPVETFQDVPSKEKGRVKNTQLLNHGEISIPRSESIARVPALRYSVVTLAVKRRIASLMPRDFSL